MGTGIGISIIKSILKKLDHTFKIKSIVGKGTKFKIIIKNIIERTYDELRVLASETLKSINSPNISKAETEMFEINKMKNSYFINYDDNSLINIKNNPPRPNNKNLRKKNSKNVLNEYFNVDNVDKKKNLNDNLINYNSNLKLSPFGSGIRRDGFSSNHNLLAGLTNQSIDDSSFEGSLNNYSILKKEKEKVKHKHKILLVDDCELMRKSNIKIFNGLENFNSNCEIIEGSDEIDILKYIMDDQLRGNKIDLILSDENMEYLQGSMAFSILKSLESQQKIKKINKFSLTAFSDEETLLEMKNNGSDEIFYKPLSIKNAKSIFQKISDTAC